MTILAVRDDLLGKPRKECPTFIDYTAQNAMKSIYNTPCVWGVYILNLVLKWVQREGGVSGKLYSTIKTLIAVLCVL